MPKVTYLEEGCAARFAALTKKQDAEAQVIINEAFRNCVLDDRQIPQALEFVLESPPSVALVVAALKVLSKSQSTKSPVTEILNSYYVPEEAFERNDVSSIKEEEEVRVEKNKYGIGIEKEKEELPDSCLEFVDMDFKKDKKNETKEFEVGTGFDQKNHEPLQVVEKVTDEVVGLRFENDIEVEKEASMDCRESAEMNNCRRMELEPKQEIMNEALEESDQKTLVGKDEIEKFRRVEEKLCVDDEWCLNRVEDRFVIRQFDPGGPYGRNGKSLENACKGWKKKITDF
ncbi:hypothetical protein C2G38_2241599 [Gigaspora rosea]|uniref:Uncharacterized protein n=1 Tax=Gigaspora rosea TaxID=44941 RepID=A0A397VRD5_9GLOM|nr:hypothetical protein C2G38_2241599 [Gigaspora rosea]